MGSRAFRNVRRSAPSGRVIGWRTTGIGTLVVLATLGLQQAEAAETAYLVVVAIARATPGVDDQDRPIATAPPQRQAVDLELPLSLNGTYLGDVTATVGSDDVVTLPVDRVATLLGERVVEGARIQLLALAGRRMTLAELAEAGLTFVYDPGRLSVDARIEPPPAGLTQLTLRPSRAIQPEDVVNLAEFSAGVSIIGRAGYVHESDFDPTGVEPFRADLRGFVSVGGFDGWALLWLADYDDDRAAPWRRGPVTLVHDDYERAIRYSIGDVRGRGQAFQIAPDILGVSVERDYSSIQPFRNIQPSGRSSFTLDRPARVTVEVNGIVTTTLDLAAGPYDIRDFTFAQGSNQVRILVEDDFGVRELASFSTFADVDLLSSDVSVFGVTAGVLRERITDEGRLRYTDDPVLTAYYARGLSDSVTVGGQIEISGETSQVGLSGAVGTRFGLLATQVAASISDDREGWAALVRYRLPPVEWRRLTHEVDAQIEHRTAGFASIGDFGARDDDETRYDFRYLARRGVHFAGVTLSRVQSRVTSSFVSLTAGTSWRGWTFSGAYQPSVGGSDRADRFLLNVSRRLGRTATFRGRQATSPGETEIEFQRFTSRRVGEWGGRLGASDIDGVRRFDGDLTVTRSRGELDFSHVTETRQNDDRIRRSVSEARLGVGLGFAQGRFAVGRPFTDGFVMVTPHPSLRGQRIVLREGASGPVAAVADRWGPGLAPLQRAYQPETFAAEVAELPLGYDLGAAQFTAVGGPRSGFVYQVGSDAANTVVGVLLAADGTPVPLAVGELRALDTPDSAPIAFFTNRAGRMVAERVPAGRYAVVLSNGSQAQDVFIAETARGLVDLGTLRLKETP